jgi:hypothetical protein
MTRRNTRSRSDAAGRLERMTLSPAIALAFVGLTFAGCVASPGRESQSPKPSASASTLLETEVDGYSLSVTVDHPTLAPGETATFMATFHNGTRSPIDYDVPWCGGAAGVQVQIALPTEPSGRTWPGIAGQFKQYVLKEGYGPGGVPALKPLASNVYAKPCEEGQLEAMLGPGESVTSSLPWKAEIVAGVPALAGPVPFTVLVGYDRQNGPPSYPPDYKGPRGSWFPIYKQLIVKGVLEVEGTARTLAGPGEVIDSILADAKFTKWLAEDPPSTWSNANLFLTSPPKAQGILPAGPSWELDLFKEVGVPRHWAIAFIDPFDASIRSVTYCNVPCDR